MPSVPRPAHRAGSLALALGALLVAAPLAGQEKNERAQLIADLDSIARTPVLGGKVAGLSAAVVQGNDTLLLEGYGLGSVELHVPTPDDAVYEIGSVTKQFTAAAILQLAEQGKVDLDADFTEYLPDYDTGGRRITVRQLLDHTSGIKGYTEMESFGSIATRDLPRDSLVAMFEAEPFTFEPGTAEIYNNSAFFLAGLIIEKVSGKSYEDYVQEDIFDELGMRHSAYCSNREVLRNKVSGYGLGPDGDIVQGGFISHNWPYAAGSLCSSAGDLITWLKALHGGRVVSPAMYREMTTGARLSDGTQIRYGMGLYVGDDPNGHRVISHGGGIPGYLSDSRYYPEADLYVVVLQNSAAPPGPEAVGVALAKRILGAGAEPRSVALRNARDYVGTYVGPVRGRQDGRLVIAEGEDGLTMKMGEGQGPPGPMVHVGDDTFRAGTQVIRFVREGGRVTAVRLDAGYAHYVMRKE